MQEENKPLQNDENYDEFVIGKGFNVDESSYNESSGSKGGKGKKSGVLKSVIWVLAIIAVSVGLAFGVIYAGADYLGIGFGRGSDCVVEIPEGAGAAVIAERLHEAGAVKIPMLFRLYSRVKKYDSQYKYGVYTFNSELGYSGLADMLVTQGQSASTVRITVPEMASIDDIAKLFEENGVCTRADFIDVVQNRDFDYDFVKEIPIQSVHYRLEGYLFPDTYDFYCGEDSKKCAFMAVDKMLKNFRDKTKDLKGNESDYTFHEIMTMASIVELEAGGSSDEMSNVAAVFYNRLKSPDFATLGSSPTIKYPYGDGRYNTYESKGLPPGPLCSPSLNSIKAAYSPTKDFNYYYFVTDASMKFYYNKTFAEHNKTINKLKAEKNWIDE